MQPGLTYGELTLSELTLLYVMLQETVREGDMISSFVRILKNERTTCFT